MKAACFSVAVMDYFPQKGEFHAGGNALNQAIQCSREGFDTLFIGAVGNDVAGNRILDLLRKTAVDVSHLVQMPGKTASNSIIIDELGERHSVEGAWDSGVYAKFRLSDSDWECIDECDLVVTHANCPDYQNLLNRDGNGQLVAVDFLHLDDFELMRKSAGAVDVIFSGGCNGMIADLRQIARDTSLLIVLTLGADGSMAFFNDEVYEQEALPIGRVVDTTGCGDAFQAAFTCEFFRSRDIQECLIKGAHAGRFAAERIGAAEWL